MKADFFNRYVDISIYWRYFFVRYFAQWRINDSSSANLSATEATDSGDCSKVVFFTFCIQIIYNNKEVGFNVY